MAASRFSVKCFLKHCNKPAKHFFGTPVLGLSSRVYVSVLRSSRYSSTEAGSSTFKGAGKRAFVLKGFLVCATLAGGLEVYNRYLTYNRRKLITATPSINEQYDSVVPIDVKVSRQVRLLWLINLIFIKLFMLNFHSAIRHELILLLDLVRHSSVHDPSALLIPYNK